MLADSRNGNSMSMPYIVGSSQRYPASSQKKSTSSHAREIKAQDSLPQIYNNSQLNNRSSLTKALHHSSQSASELPPYENNTQHHLSQAGNPQQPTTTHRQQSMQQLPHLNI